MGKKISLLERLDTALGATSSETGREKVYALLSQTSSLAIDTEIEEFYSKRLNFESLIPEGDKNYDSDDANKGKVLEKILRSKIVLPQRNIRGYGKKYGDARRKEYQIINDFYNEGSNESQL